MNNEFERIAKERGIPEDILRNMEKRLGGNEKEFHLTPLQMEVFQSETFWGEEKPASNLIIQGATSSGKTLIAEMAAFYQIERTKKVVYLVPLKALVSEKFRAFRHDAGDNRLKIYESSADYQDHDADLTEGKYDICVAVYEKFFALLAQSQGSSFLKDCGLIVVDEMQMLSSEERGAKLEFALEKILLGKKDFPDIRIIGLTTIDCDTSEIEKWLGAPPSMKNETRPVELIERFVTEEGIYWERTLTKESAGGDKTLPEPLEGRLKIYEVGKNVAVKDKDKKKFDLLFSILKETEEDKKVMVFCNSRKKCRELAQSICKSGLFPKKSISEGVDSTLSEYEDEDETRILRDETLLFGVAYHHAGLSMTVRECIEEQFKDADGCARVIVVTETLTMGLNLPADVIILYDYVVGRGATGGYKELTVLEYRNIIGRAGRLGISERGESYLLVETERELKRQWRSYVSFRKEILVSSLKGKEEKELAPYYINLLDKDFASSQIDMITKRSLFASDVKSEKILDLLEKCKLVARGDNDDWGDEKFYLLQLGISLAPFALSLDTCKKIEKYFVHGDRRGLPDSVAASDVSKYLLDILFIVCQLKEISKSNSSVKVADFSQPSQKVLFKEQEKAVLSYLKETNEEDFWGNSFLRELRNAAGDIEIDPVKLNAAYRAIILFQWTQGLLAPDIRKKLKLPQNAHLYSADIERLSESCAYLIEAISNASYIKDDGRNLARNLYFLSGRVKYGMTEKLVTLANRHVRGLTRRAIFKIGKASEELRWRYASPSSYVLSCTDEEWQKSSLTLKQLEELKKSLGRRYTDSLEHLIHKIVYEDSILSPEIGDMLANLSSPNQQKEWDDDFRRFMEKAGLNITDANVQGHYKVKCEDDVYVFIPDHKNAEQTTNYARYKERYASFLLFFISVQDNSPPNIDGNWMKRLSFCHILVQCIIFDGKDYGKLFCRYIKDASSEDLLSTDPESIRGRLDLLSFSTSKRKSQAERESNDEDINPIKAFLKEHNYEKIGDLGSKGSQNAKVISVKDLALSRDYAVKCIRVPDERKDFDNFAERAEKIKDIFDDGVLRDKENLSAEKWEKVKQDIGLKGDFDGEILNKALEAGHKRLGQLEEKASPADQRLAFAESFSFFLEVEKRLKEARTIAELTGDDVIDEKHHIIGVYSVDKLKKHDDRSDCLDADHSNNELLNMIFITMPLLNGSLHEFRGQKKLEIEHVLSAARQICDALDFVHEKGILHRDVKPANILYKKAKDEKFSFYLSDFGSIAEQTDRNKTMGVGTHGYRAPELIESTDYDHRVDIYSLGKVIHDLLPGEAPEGLENILKKACAVDPGDRYQSAKEFKDALEKCKEN
jgi:replicative superfamily II helicase/serine/threonine protein kinase